MKPSIPPLWYQARKASGGAAYVLWDTPNLVVALVRADAGAFVSSWDGDPPMRIVIPLSDAVLKTFGGAKQHRLGERASIPAGIPHQFGGSRADAWALEVSRGARNYGPVIPPPGTPGAPSVPPTFLYRIQEAPWGRGYVLLGENLPATAKMLCVYPGMRLSLQSHEWRDEWWMFLTGGSFRIGDEQLVGSPGREVVIPRGTRHRLGSRESRDYTWVLEVATGNVDEKDITRYEDDHGRV